MKMIKHIFIVAVRNLLKYRQQTIISIIGLAIGFVCFALSAYWIQYERSFDAFHKNADQIYQVRKIDPKEEFGQYINTPPPLAKTLEKYFPEIIASCASTRNYEIEPGKDSKYMEVQEVDENFFNMFDVTFLSGTFDFNDQNGIFVTETFAKDHFHTNNPIGKELIWYVGGKEHQKFTVKGVVKEWPKNTNLPFQAIRPMDSEDMGKWYDPGYTYILLRKETDPHAFKEKFEKLQVKEALENPSYTMVPLTEAYYTEPTYNDAGLKFEQVVLFALLGLLVIVCALFNYLNLYASRIRIRVKELSLRKVNGASNREVFILLSTEFILLLLIACAFGFTGIECTLSAFKKFADIQSDHIHIYTELGTYIIIWIGVSLLLVFLVIYYTRRQLFQESVRMVTSSNMKSLFGKLSLVFQMIIGLGFIFCTTIYFKQIYTLGHASPGFERNNIMTVQISPKNSDFVIYSENENDPVVNTAMDAIKKIPSVEIVISLGEGTFLPRLISSSSLARIEGMSEEELVEYDNFCVHPDYLRFYGLQLLAGNDFKPVAEENGKNVIINETAAKALGLKDPVGKTFFEVPKAYYTYDGRVYKNQQETPRLIIGVIKDFVYESPIVKVKPVVMICRNTGIGIGVKCKPGTYEETQKAIETFVENNMPENKTTIFNLEKKYEEQYASEASLQSLLALLCTICILISLFGIYSVVALNCEYRRKEIAVRKVNGASLISIFGLFFKEYIVLLGIAAVISFPIGYIIMKPWTEKYILQTEINWWIYPLLFLVAAIVVLLTITGRVWRTAHMNASAELKKE